jgi:hypothetical protein
MTSSAARKIAVTCAVVGLATVGVAATSTPANAWWYHHGCCWGGVGVVLPPVVVAPPPVYAPAPTYYPAPAYYAPPARAWIPAHWQNGYWVPGHWS